MFVLLVTHWACRLQGHACVSAPVIGDANKEHLLHRLLCFVLLVTQWACRLQGHACVSAPVFWDANKGHLLHRLLWFMSHNGRVITRGARVLVSLGMLIRHTWWLLKVVWSHSGRAIGRGHACGCVIWGCYQEAPMAPLHPVVCHVWLCKGVPSLGARR